MSRKFTPVEALHRNWMKNPKYRAAYDALEEEFSLAAALIDARSHADLTQQDVARRMKTSQAFVANMEGQKGNPSVKTLQRYAAATGTRLRITFEPMSKRQ